MITEGNIKEILESLDLIDMAQELAAPEDYISIWVSYFNTGSYAEVHSLDYSEARDEEHNNNGMLFMDKDTFVELLEENNIDYE